MIILKTNYGKLPENDCKRQEVRRYLTHDLKAKPDHGEDILMAAPKADRAELAKYLLEPEAEQDGRLIAQGLRAGMTSRDACAQIKIPKGSPAGPIWERLVVGLSITMPCSDVTLMGCYIRMT